MADEEKKEDEEEQTEGVEEEPKKKKKKGLLLGGGVLGLVAAAYALTLAAVPKAAEDVPFQGPFVVDLSAAEGKIQVNLAGGGGKRYLVMTLKAEVFAYDQAYPVGRTADLHYQAMEKDALIRVARQKTKEDLDDVVGEDVFKQEIRDAIDPLLFPIHVGNPTDPNKPHEESGLAPGKSQHRGTMRARFHSTRIAVDAPRKTLILGEGEPTTFEGYEKDLMLQDEAGHVVYVDVTGLDPEFVGDVPVGTLGVVRNLYFDKLLVQ